MKRIIKVFLKIVVFFFVWVIGFLIWSYVDVMITDGAGAIIKGIQAFLLFPFKFPVVAYYLSFSKWANENIWKWVDKNILNILINNNSITPSQRNEAIGFLKKGNNEYRKGKFNEAIKYYTKALDIDSNFKEAYNNREKAIKKL